MIWCLDYMADIESDLSVFHRVEDIESLDGPRFFRLTHRLAAYSGVMAARIVEHEQAGQPQGGAGPARGQVNNVPVSALAAPTGTPGMPPLVEIAKASG